VVEFHLGDGVVYVQGESRRWDWWADALWEHPETLALA
jgi:hypothetical protein